VYCRHKNAERGCQNSFNKFENLFSPAKIRHGILFSHRKMAFWAFRHDKTNCHGRKGLIGNLAALATPNSKVTKCVRHLFQSPEYGNTKAKMLEVAGIEPASRTVIRHPSTGLSRVFQPRAAYRASFLLAKPG